MADMMELRSPLQAQVVQWQVAPGDAVRKELEAVPAGPQREALYQSLVDRQYRDGQAIPMAATLEIDAVIDPAQTRDWLVRGLASAPVRCEAAERHIDTW